MEALLHAKIAEFKKKMTKRELEIFDQRIFSDSPVTFRKSGIATAFPESGFARSKKISSKK